MVGLRVVGFRSSIRFRGRSIWSWGSVGSRSIGSRSIGSGSIGSGSIGSGGMVLMTKIVRSDG